MDRRLYLHFINKRVGVQSGGNQSKQKSETISTLSNLKLDTDKTDPNNSLTYLSDVFKKDEDIISSVDFTLSSDIFS